MKSTTKGILTAIPLVMGLAGPAAATLSDSSAGDGVGGPENVIDSAFNQFAGLPGDAETQNPSHSQLLSTFTPANGIMASYFTNKGVDRTSPNQPLVPEAVVSLGSSSGSNSGSAGNGSDPGVAVGAPAVAAITVARYAPDTLVNAVASAGALAPSSPSDPGQITVSDTTSQTQVSTSTQTPGSTPVSTPIPPAAALLGSGLTALAALRKRNRDTLAG
jgi:hypothetical protein